MRIKISNRAVKEVKFFGNVLTRYDYCRREIKIRTSMARDVFNKKKNHFWQTS